MLAGLGLILAVLPLFGLLLLWTSSLLDERFANILYKLHLLRTGVLHLMFSTDKKWKKQPDPAMLTGSEEFSKRIIFIRHGESAWNLVFNKGFNSTFPKRMGDALRNEASMATTLDSVFVDSPLDGEGCEQAQSLQDFVEKAEDTPLVKILRGSEGNSVICSSNLRRALSTTTIGLWERLRRTQEKVHVLSSLQEITFNIDGVALAKPGTAPQLSHVELAALGSDLKSFEADRYYDCSEQNGDKEIQGSGIDRMYEYCNWCFERKEPVIIAGGHSLYFRAFFQTFLAHESAHTAKKHKMENAAVVAFTLFKGTKNGKVMYKIDEASIEAMYLGFEEKKPKKSKSKKAQ